MIKENYYYQQSNKDAQEIIDYLYEIYCQHDVCMGDLLTAIQTKDIPGSDKMSLDDWHFIYMALMSYVEGDRFYRAVNDGEPEDYVK